VSISSIVFSLSLLEADQAVGVVLEEDEAVVGGEPHQGAPLLQGERAAGRVVEVGNDVRERHLALGAGRLDRRGVDPVCFEWCSDELRAGLFEQQQRAVVGGLLDHHAISLGDQMPEEEGRGLHRPVGDHHPLGLDAVELRDPLAEPEMAAPGAIAEGPLPVRFQGMGSGLAHGLVRQDVGAWRASSEADRPFGHWRVEYTSGAILRLQRG